MLLLLDNQAVNHTDTYWTLSHTCKIFWGHESQAPFVLSHTLCQMYVFMTGEDLFIMIYHPAVWDVSIMLCLTWEIADKEKETTDCCGC